MIDARSFDMFMNILTAQHRDGTLIALPGKRNVHCAGDFPLA
jgi:hypothetical protein